MPNIINRSAWDIRRHNYLVRHCMNQVADSRPASGAKAPFLNCNCHCAVRLKPCPSRNAYHLRPNRSLAIKGIPNQLLARLSQKPREAGTSQSIINARSRLRDPSASRSPSALRVLRTRTARDSRPESFLRNCHAAAELRSSTPES